LVEVEINVASLQALNRLKQINERAAQPIDGPSHHHIEPPTLRLRKQGVEPWPILASLGPADPRIAEGLDDLPSSRLATLLSAVILNRLSIGTHPDV